MPELVPPRPRFYANGCSTRWPRLITPDGRDIPRTCIDLGGDLVAIDLDIDSGTICAERDVAWDHTVVMRRYDIAPYLRPVTRYAAAVQRQDGQRLVTVSDAVLFRIESADGSVETRLNWGAMDISDAQPYRVIALYANRTSEVIFEHRPVSISRYPLAILAVCWLAALVLVGRTMRADG